MRGLRTLALEGCCAGWQKRDLVAWRGGVGSFPLVTAAVAPKPGRLGHERGGLGTDTVEKVACGALFSFAALVGAAVT